MEGEAEATRTAGLDTRNSRSHEAFKLLKVRISKEDVRSPRKSQGDASNHSNLGGHGGAASWFWRNSYSGAPPLGYPESPKLYTSFSGTDSSRCPSSPAHVPVAMAYTPAPGYVMFPVMLSGAPDSPRGGLTPLMGSPVSTPTAMMFPQTPFAQHPSAGPFAPPQGPAGPPMRPTSMSGAQQVSGGPQGPDGSSAFFHPLFNGFNAFGPPPGVGMQAAPHGAFSAPGAPPMVPVAPSCAKQPRSSAAGDKGRPYQPSPLKPGPRKSSSNGGPPSGGGSFPSIVSLVGRNSNPAPVPGGNGSSGVSVSPQPIVAASSGVRTSSRSINGQGYQTPAHGGYQHPHGQCGGNGTSGGVDGGGTDAAAAAVSNMSSGPTPRTSYTGPAVPPQPRSSLSGGLGATASGRTSSSGVAMTSSAAANALAANMATHVSLQDGPPAPLPSSGLDADGVGLSSGDVDIPPYGNFVAHGMAHQMGGHAAAAAAAASAVSAWGFYDAAGGIGSQQMWPGAMPRLFGAAPHMIGNGITHMSHPHNHQVAAMAAVAQQHVPQAQSSASMQQPSLLHAAMLQQLAAAANVPAAMPPMPTPMPCYVAAPSPLDSDYMAAAAAENLQVQLQSLHGAIIASQNLRAAAAAVADMQQQQQHPGVMASVAASAAGLSSGGMLMNPAFLSGALGAHHASHHNLPGTIHMHGLGMGAGLAPRQRRNHSNGVGVGPSAAAAGGVADGQVRLNARQRRTLRRAKERAIRGLLEAGKLLVARTMGENGGEGDEGAASGCDIPSGGYDTDDGDQSDDGESPARPACVSACSASAVSGGAASSPEVSVTGVSSSASGAAPSGVATAAVKYPAAADAASPTPDPASGGQSGHHMAGNGDCRSPGSSNASSVCEAGSSGGARAVSNASSVGGPEAAHMGAANRTPSSGKVSPLSAEGSNEPSPAPAPAAPPRANTGVAVDARVSPAPSGRSTSAANTSAGSAVAAAAALASGTASELDITALIQQLNQKREEGLVDEKLLRDLEIINNLIGALKSSVPNAAPSYNAQGRKPSGSHPHSHGHGHHHGHGNVNGGHPMHYLNTMQKLPKGFAVGY